MDYSLPIVKINADFLKKFLQSDVLLYFAVLLLAVRICLGLCSINFPQNIFFADITKVSLENFANQTRQSAGLPALSANQKLDQAAKMKAENMVQNNYFAHTSPTGITPWHWFLQAGYNYKYAGENLAIGFFESEEVFNAWMNSPLHKANILNPNYNEVGTAVLSGFGQNSAIVVVQEFASPLPEKTAKIVKENTEKPVVAQQEAPKENNSTPSVLSQTIESKTFIEGEKFGGTSIYYKLMSSILYDYDEVLQSIIFGVSLIVIGILLTLIYFNIGTEIKRELVFRAILIVVLLSCATLLDKELIILFIPHQVII